MKIIINNCVNIILLIAMLASFQSSGQGIEKVVKSDSEWKSILTPEQYYVTRENGTELAFSGEYDHFYKEGSYICINCGNLLFDSESKFDSGSGWPSYFEPAKEQSVDIIEDRLFGMVGKEIVCAKCNAHLGHVFEDGPKPAGLRYCVNSVALSFTRLNKKK